MNVVDGGISKYFRDKGNPQCPHCAEFFTKDEIWTVPEDNIYETDCPHCGETMRIIVEDTRVFTTGFEPSEEQKEQSRKLWEHYNKNKGDTP